MRWRLWLLLCFGLAVLLLVGCNAQRTIAFKLAPESVLPEFLHSAHEDTRVAYRFAAANHHELQNYPCFCGCVYMGHLNNADCYIKAVDEAGTITWDEHASGCAICVEITQDVMRLLQEGKSSQAIRGYIDAEYSGRGPGTNTPPLS